MAAKILLTPDELKAQAAEMKALKSEYESLFAGVSGVLKKANNNWSTNIANNFAGKINSVQKNFNYITTLLENGANIAITSASTFENVDSILAKNGIVDTEKIKELYGSAVSTAVEAISNEKVKKSNKTKKVEKKGWFDKLKDACVGITDAVVTKTKKVFNKAIKSYQEKGEVYKWIQYGKCSLRVVSATVKIVGAVGTVAASGGAGLPVAAIGIISAGNDFINACNDAAYVYTGQYDKVGTTNYLKDTLVKNGGEIGEMLGNKKAGEVIGSLTYTGIDVVSFLNGADKVLKSFGKINTLLTGTTGYSKIWGKTSFDDVINTSAGEIICDTAKNIYKTGKKAYGLGEKLTDIAMSE